MKVGDEAAGVVTGQDNEPEPGILPGLNEEPQKQPLGTFPGLPVETEKQLKLDYLQWRPIEWSFEYIWITNYFGTYNGGVVVLMESYGDMTVITRVPVADKVFVYHYSTTALVWKQDDRSIGRFYTITEAYDTGVLTLDDIHAVHALHREAYPYSVQFEPEPATPPKPEHFCEFFQQKHPACDFAGCEW